MAIDVVALDCSWLFTLVVGLAGNSRLPAPLSPQSILVTNTTLRVLLNLRNERDQQTKIFWSRTISCPFRRSFLRHPFQPSRHSFVFFFHFALCILAFATWVHYCDRSAEAILRTTRTFAFLFNHPILRRSLKGS